MMRVKTLLVVLLFLLVGVMPCAHAQLVGVPFEIFTTNGAHYDDPNVVLLMDVIDGFEIAEFIFYNNSTVACSIARIYFDDGTLLDINSIESSGPAVKFNRIYPGPGNLPGGELLDPPFVADLEFSIGGETAPPHKGIDNPGEWLKVTFDLINGGTLEDVIEELHDGTLRVGIHVIAFPDDSSESAIPEPATIGLLGLGALVLLRKRKRA